MMKTIFRLFCGWMAIALAACTSDELSQVEEMQNPITRLVSVKAYTPGEQPDSRLAFEEKQDGLGISWAVGDAFTAVIDEEPYNFTYDEESGKFTAQLPENTVIANGTKAYYPAYTGEYSENLSRQAGTLDSNVTYMEGTYDESTNAFSFVHSTAILKADFTGLPDGAEVSSVEVIAATYTITIPYSDDLDLTSGIYIYLPAIAKDKEVVFNVTTSNGDLYTATKTVGIDDGIKTGTFYTASIALVEVPFLTFSSLNEQTLTTVTDQYNDDDETISQVEVEVAGLEYSVGGGAWQLLGTSTVEFGGNKGDLRLRGMSESGTATSVTNYATILFGKQNVDVACSGDIRTLVDWKNYAEANTENAKFIMLFKGCTQLTSAPALPATILAEECYRSMFEGCSSLTTAPELHAEALASYCYYRMFYGCTSLTTAPELPAITLAMYCYASMFYGCSSLTTAPVLPAETLANGCYSGMFQSCSSLNSVTMLATDVSASYCLYIWLKNVSTTGTFTKAEGMTTIPTNSASGIPTGWTVKVKGGEQETVTSTNYLTFTAAADGQSLKLSSELSGLEYSTDGETWTALGTNFVDFQNKQLFLRGKSSIGTMGRSIVFGNSDVTVACSGDIRTLVNYENYTEITAVGTETSFHYLFEGCTVLTSAPELPFTTLAENCYNRMFYGCTSLTSAPALPAETLAEACYANMFVGCKKLTTAPALPATTLKPNCYESMFESCTLLASAPALSATTLAENCCYNMFSKCTSLTTVPTVLPATTLAPNCYYYMFNGCTSLTSAPALPAETLATKCYASMFVGCKKLTTAPALPATTLAESCYQSMFYDCTSLTSAPALPAETLVQSCYNQMFWGCSNLNSVTMLATNISASNCLTNWLVYVSSSGTFTKAAGMTIPGIPSGWTVQDYVAPGEGI